MFKKITYKEVFTFLFCCFFSVLLNKVISGGCFLSLAVFISGLYLNLNAISMTLAFIVGFIPLKNFTYIFCSLIASAILNVIFYLYKKKKAKVKGELILYAILSSSVFLFAFIEQNIISRLIQSALTVVLTFIFISALNVLFFKKLSYKLSVEENLCLAVFTVFIQVGFIKLFGAIPLSLINIFIILSSVYVTKNSASLLVGITLSLPESILTFSFTPVSVYVLLTISALIFVKNPRIFSAFSLCFLNLFFTVVLKTSGELLPFDVFYTIIPCVVFLFIPNDFLDGLSLKYKDLQSKNLPKTAINRARLILSSKLYGVSDVFSEIENSFLTLKESRLSSEQLQGVMINEIISSCCGKCVNYPRCKIKNQPSVQELNKILQVGIAKGRVSFMDLTKEFSENCGFTNSVLFEMNSLIGKYKEKIRDLEDISEGKELVMMQAKGISTILKNMATDLSKSVEFDGKKERIIEKTLKKRGIIPKELMLVITDNLEELELVIDKKYFKPEIITACVNVVLKKQTVIVDKIDLSKTVISLTIKPTPAIDASFGLSTHKKDGSLCSGDTHSLQKISENRFLLALSDGMGSGSLARNTSNSCISLIESFYKAGLPENLIINLVNKILAVNNKENFSAIDILTVDLYNLNANFIKVGSPFSFILSDSDIKIIEGSSLPLGILDQTKPVGTSTTLNDGNTVIMCSDGITDAFGSSTGIINYLKTLPNRNPQTLADSILNKARSLSGGYADDMTVIAVRIFKKAS